MRSVGHLLIHFFLFSFLGRPPSTSTGRTYFPMWFATEEQTARGKCQIVHVMHRCEHIDSYEVFREEIDREEQDRRMGVGLKELGLR